MSYTQDLKKEQKNFLHSLDSFNTYESSDQNIPLKSGTIVKVKDIQSMNRQHKRHVTTYHWKEQFNGDGERYPIVSTETMTYVLKGVINQNLSDGFTLVTLVGKCLTGGTKVVLSNGAMVNIESLGQYNEQTINVKVRTDGSAHREKAKRFFKYEQRPVIELITETGKSIVGTYNHPLLAVNGKKWVHDEVSGKNIGNKERYGWKQLKDIAIGDKLKVVPRISSEITSYIPTNFKLQDRKYGPRYRGRVPQFMTEELAAVCGYIIGDGWVRKKAVEFMVAPDEHDIAPVLTGYMDRLFDLKPYVKLASSKNVATIEGMQIARTMDMQTVSYFSLPLVEMLSFLKDKRVPQLIFESRDSVIASFIKWLFEADGNIHNRKSEWGFAKSQMALTSVNLELLRDVQLLLLRFGIHSRIYRRKRNDGAWYLAINRKESMIKFIKEIGFVSAKKQAKAADAMRHLSVDTSDRKHQKHREFQYEEKVVNILYHLKPRDVYDIEVPMSHSFIANGIMSHNSGTGKSTLSGTAVHRLHEMFAEMGHQYAVSWYRRDAIGKIDDVIDSLPKGVNRIMVFDDATFGDRDLTEEEAKTLIARLTYVRHDLQANVIVIINMHYSKGLGPFLRDGNITWWTSITHIEKENMLKIYGWKNSAIIQKFFKKYGSMLKNRVFTSEVNQSDVIWNYSKAPFKLAFCADYDSLHFTCYPAESCAFCQARFDDNVDKKKRFIAEAESELYRKLQASYKHPSYIVQAVRWLMWSRGADCLEPKHKAIINHLTEFYERKPDDLQNLIEELKERGVDTVLKKRGLAIKRETIDKLKRKRKENRDRVREIRLKDGTGDGSRYNKKEESVSVGDLGEAVQYEKEDKAYDEETGENIPEATREGLDAAGVYNPSDSGQSDGDEDDSGEFEN